MKRFFIRFITLALAVFFMVGCSRGASDVELAERLADQYISSVERTMDAAQRMAQEEGQKTSISELIVIFRSKGYRQALGASLSRHLTVKEMETELEFAAKTESIASELHHLPPEKMRAAWERRFTAEEKNAIQDLKEKMQAAISEVNPLKIIEPAWDKEIGALRAIEEQTTGNCANALHLLREAQAYRESMGLPQNARSLFMMSTLAFHVGDELALSYAEQAVALEPGFRSTLDHIRAGERWLKEDECK